MKTGAFVGRRPAGHSNADTARCPVCRDPARIHNSNGCVRAECECEQPYGDPNAVETPRRPDDAGEEVAAADPVATGAAATALENVAALVDRVLSTAYFVAPRWYCPACHDWHLDPGACAVCRIALQPVYLATLPREI